MRPIFEVIRWVWRGWPGLGRAQMETRTAAGGWVRPVEPSLNGASTRPRRILLIIGTLSRPVEALADLALYNTKMESESLDGFDNPIQTCQASLLLEF